MGTFDLGVALAQRDRATARQDRVFGAGWRGVWEMGPHGELIGRRAASLTELEPNPGAAFALTGAEDYEEVDSDGAFLPALISGRLEGVDPGAALAVALNGTIAAVGQAYESVDGGARTALLVPPERFRDGANSVALYEAVESGGATALRRIPSG